MNVSGPRFGVGNLRFEGCDECGLSSFVDSYVGQDELGEDMGRSGAIWDLSHLAIGINGLKRTDDFGEHGQNEIIITPEERKHALGIATTLGMSLERADEFLELFEVCVRCPKPVDGTYDTFHIENGKAVKLL